MKPNPSLSSIEDKIAKIEASGEVAEPNTWISSFTVYKPSGKRYVYYRLMRAVRDKKGKIKGKFVKYLGKKNSAEHKEMIKAIKRRNRIQELQRTLKRTMPLEKPQKRQNNKQLQSVHQPVPRSERVLLLQLQQQLQELMARFERLETKMKQGKRG